MANQEQLDVLKKGAETWNEWRYKNRTVSIDLSGSDLKRALLKKANFYIADLKNSDLSNGIFDEASFNAADLSESVLYRARLDNTSLREAKLINANLEEAKFKGADLSFAKLNKASLKFAVFQKANLYCADLSDAYLFKTSFDEADLKEANLENADLGGAYLGGASLSKARLKGANLRGANLTGADLTEADFTDADLREVTLEGADLVRTKVKNAKISNSKIFGVNVWDLEGEFKEQKEMIITPNDASVITVDNIKVAQFVYLILNNQEIRDVLNTLTSKTVLILGRFSPPERKAVLDALRNKLREYGLLPIVFDFERPDDKDFTETIKTLAGMCYFVIADVTNPKSSPLELQATIPDYQIPFVPIIQEGEYPFAMMQNLQTKYEWVLETMSYKDSDQLIRILKKGIIDRAMQKHDELRLIKAQSPTVISASQFEE